MDYIRVYAHFNNKDLYWWFIPDDTNVRKKRLNKDEKNDDGSLRVPPVVVSAAAILSRCGDMQSSKSRLHIPSCRVNRD